MMAGSTPAASEPPLVYKASPKHCEPITAQRPGTKCPRWSVDIAQTLLETSEVMGEKRVNTRDGLAFVAQRTGDGTWHGYPEAWDRIDPLIIRSWLEKGLIRNKDLRRWRTQEAVWLAWKELDDAK